MELFISDFSKEKHNKLTYWPMEKIFLLQIKINKNIFQECNLFILFRINLYCTKIIESYLEELINSLAAIIPSEWLSIFEPWEF